MASTTANQVVTGALQLGNVIDPEDTPTAAMLSDGFRRLNMMMGQWSIQSLTIPVVAREVFSLVSGQGGPTNPYTIGPGGDFDTTRPKRLEGAGLLLGNTSPAVEMPRAVLTDDAYEAIQIKDLANALFTSVYYNATFDGGLGRIYLWPVPNTTDNQLVLYRSQQLGLFTSATTSYDLPEGANEPMEYQLALRLAPVWGVPLSAIPDVVATAASSFGIFKRSNVKINDMPQDVVFPPADRRYGYNINTGTGS